jgi:predicted DNA-binding transcriptional regulator AlpA
MSLLTQAWLLEKYGARLTLDQLADALAMSKNTIYNQVSQGTFPVRTYLDGKRYADYRDVAEHFDRCRSSAASGGRE